MELHPILSAMRRNKVGAIVIVVQTAITLAILCNSLFLIQQRLRSSERPTGLQEQDIFTMANQWVGNPRTWRPKCRRIWPHCARCPRLLTPSPPTPTRFPMAAGTTGSRSKPGMRTG